MVGKKNQQKPEEPTPADAQNSPEDNTPADDTSADQSPAEAAQTPMVALSMEEFEIMQRELEENRKKAADYFDGWQRERADFVNYKKRIERDTVLNQQNALVNVVRKHLVVLDDLERALKMRPTSGDGAEWSNGIELIYRKLLNLLDGEGVTPMKAQGEMFDPTRHEAITHEDSPDHESGAIIDFVQSGYTIGDRVVLPDLVRVAR